MILWYCLIVLTKIVYLYIIIIDSYEKQAPNHEQNILRHLLLGQVNVIVDNIIFHI